MAQYRVDLTIRISGYTDADSWCLRGGWFEFLVDGEIKARYPELSVKTIRRAEADLALTVEYPDNWSPEDDLEQFADAQSGAYGEKFAES